MFCKKITVAFYHLYWYVDSLYDFWTILHTDFFNYIFCRDHIKRKAFFSTFWNYCNNAWMFSILNNSFQRMVYVFRQGIKLSDNLSDKVSDNFAILRWIAAFERKSFSSIATSCSFIIRVSCSSSKFYSFTRLYIIWLERLNSFPETLVCSYVLFI